MKILFGQCLLLAIVPLRDFRLCFVALPLVSYSALTGENVPELVRTLTRVAIEVPPERDDKSWNCGIM